MGLLAITAPHASRLAQMHRDFSLALQLRKFRKIFLHLSSSKSKDVSGVEETLDNCENNQQDALYRLICYSKSALHVSGDVFAHNQEHLTVFTVSSNVHPSCCWLVS
jgi:hypothetical protein